MMEQAAAALAEIAQNSADMQDAIIAATGVESLLNFIRTGSQLGQEQASRAIWHLAALTESQMDLVGCGAIPDLVQLLKVGSMMAQEMSAAGATLAVRCKCLAVRCKCHFRGVSYVSL